MRDAIGYWQQWNNPSSHDTRVQGYRTPPQKNYVDLFGSPKFVVTSRTIPTTANADTIVYTLSTDKTVSNGKIMVCSLWMERGSGAWFNSNCSEFTEVWSLFYLLTRGPTILVYFSGYPAGLM